MIFKTTREGALQDLENYINNEIVNYSTQRNFDFGPGKRKNVSCLSPYISHRLITEYEVAKKVLSKFPYQKVEKYIQEIFWRVYWKGWLELRPQVWTDFTEDLKGIEEDKNYQIAVSGKTKIQCFNDWVNELKENNYLHNHTRMWFASIWIFTLNLPWQKGAEFFMKHLYDGDAASNTLSWRWVAGLQTKGKHYIAQSWNISKFTNNKYKNVKLNETALPIIDNRNYTISPIQINMNDELSEYLIVFDNEMHIQSFDLKRYKKIYFVLLNNKNRYLKLDSKVLDFKKKIIASQLNNDEFESELLDENGFTNLIEKSINFDVAYPSIGENLSFLKKLIKEKDLKINFIIRKEDEFCWKFSNKGYFNFKSNIPIILSTFKLN